MRRAARFTFAVFITALFVAAVSCTSQSTTPNAPVAPQTTSSPIPVRKQRLRIVDAKLVKCIHDRVNRERRKHGLPTMRWDDALSRIADKHSKDMAKKKYFSHVSPEGQGFSYRYLKNGYACGITVNGVLRTGAENIFQFSLDSLVSAPGGEATPDGYDRDDITESAIRGWMDRPRDRKNILSPHWQREGIGVSIGPDNTIYITQNFC